MPTPLLSVRHLAKSYAADGVQTHVLANIDLDLFAGDFVAVMGPSGSGKSTLLYCMSGMDAPTSGEVRFRDRDLAKLPERDIAEVRAQHFGFVFQQANLVSNLTLFENIAVPGYLKNGRSPAQTREVAQSLVERMGLAADAHHLPSQASGGQQQRCAVARSVVNGPDILFADEPTGALNRANTLEVLDLVGGFHAKGQTVCMVTHDVRCAVRATRVLYLEDGAIKGELTLPPWSEAVNATGNASPKAREAQVNAWLSSLAW